MRSIARRGATLWRQTDDSDQAIHCGFIRVAVKCPAPVLRLPSAKLLWLARLCRRLRVSLSLAIVLLLTSFFAPVSSLFLCVCILQYPHLMSLAALL
jgi:hypothetical protein